MNLQFLGHSGIRLRASDTNGRYEVVIDPFLAHNPATPVKPGDLRPSHIVITHAHGDHWGDTETIARASGATVVSSAEIANYAERKGLQGHGMNVGGSHRFDFGSVRFTPAWHSSSFPDGTYGGMPMGVVIEMGGLRVYHAGDTALFTDMRLIGRLGLDVAMLPIGDNYTMGPEDALEAVRLLAPKRVIPIHYDTFPLLKQDAEAFRRRVEDETDATCIVLKPGEDVEL